jgi:hypothetical protein
MAITKKAIAAQQRSHTYFRFSIEARHISTLLAGLPAGARVSQFTGGPNCYSAWGTYHCDRADLQTAVTHGGGYCFSTQADFMGD